MPQQAAARVELALTIGAQPQRWAITQAAEAELIADVVPDAWSADGAGARLPDRAWPAAIEMGT